MLVSERNRPEQASEELRAAIADEAFPCVGAKSAWRAAR